MADIRETVSTLKAKLTRARDRANKAREDTSAAVAQGLQMVEVSGTAFGLAYARGRFGDDEGELAVMGMPVGLLGGIAGHAVAFLGIAGEYSEHVHNVSDGAFAEYAVQQGQSIGYRHKEEAEAKSGGTRTEGRIGNQRRVDRGLGAGTMPPAWARHNPAAAYARRG